MSQVNSKSGSGSGFALFLTFAIIACWFLGLDRLLGSLAVGVGIAGAVALCVVSVVTLVRRSENRSVVQVVAIKAAAATYLALFTFGAVNAVMWGVELHHEGTVLAAKLNAQHNELQAQQAQMRVQSEQALSTVQEMNVTIGQIIDAANKAR